MYKWDAFIYAQADYQWVGTLMEAVDIASQYNVLVQY